MPSAPPRLLEDVIGVNNPNASTQQVLQRLCRLLEARFTALENRNDTVDFTLAQLRDIAINRMNEVLLPAFQTLSELASLGAMFNAHSDTPMPVGVGLKLFIIDESERATFAYSGYMAAVSSGDDHNMMVGRTSTYDRNTGAFTLDVSVATGNNASHSDWVIVPSAPPFLPASVIDPGDDATSALNPTPYQVA
jgi:hypothetical protein